MNVLVDSSIWIDYFRGTGRHNLLDYLIDENMVATNDLILTELIPALRVRRRNRLISLLGEIKRYPVEIDWDDIRQMQTTCISNGINGVGIPDLIIAQNVIQNGLYLFSSDTHFSLISKYVPLPLYEC